MPTVFSKESAQHILKQFLATSTKKKALSASIVAVVLLLIKQRLSKDSRAAGGASPVKVPRKQGRGNVDKMFFQRILQLLKIVIPGWKTPEVLDLVILTIFLVGRTYLTLYLATVNGSIVNAIIKMDFDLFMKRIVKLGMIAVPASFVNSYLEFLNKRLAIHFRQRLTNYFHEQYIKNMIFYQVSNLDSRVTNPDQRLTSDIEKWANSLSQIYSNFSKPLLDIFLFTKKLTDYIGLQAPFCILLWYLFSGVMLKLVSPPFGKYTAIEQKYEGQYREVQSQLLYHAEEVAFYRGQNWEKNRINESFKSLMDHSVRMMNLRLYMGMFDGMLVKYGSVMAGYAVMGLPVFGLNRKAYLDSIGGDKTTITREYVRNSQLLINLAKAIGRMVLSYKEIQQLAGYTKVVYEMKEVLADLNSGKYKRIQVVTDHGGAEDLLGQKKQEKQSIIALDKGKVIQTEDIIEFDRVPIVSPNGDVLVKEMCFKINPGMNVVICGPNGCGKSSLFRILGSLWPVSGGQLYRPAIEKLFYIPQRPYLPPGTLRDQIIYPHSKLNMLRKKVNDQVENFIKSFFQELVKLLESVQLGYLVYREGGLESQNDWNDILSGGEKQRVAMARLFYHKPLFAILDECTSQVTIEMETIMYNTAKELGITLFTVSHRTSLFKFHEYMLKFDGEGGYQIKPINKGTA